jgi:hypothetical protein
MKSITEMPKFSIPNVEVAGSSTNVGLTSQTAQRQTPQICDVHAQ